MKIVYSKSFDAAYIYLIDEIKNGGVEKSLPFGPSKGEINLDFDKKGKFVGIEVLGASKKLPAELLQKAEKADIEEQSDGLLTFIAGIRI